MLRVTRSIGLYSSAVGREKASAATHRWGLAPSPTHQSQHRTPQGQEGETRRPETPSGLHRALGECLGSITDRARDSWAITSP